ncbi:GNAT family N-acetyltransferase [Spirilliplanes yamanashiensis]|uniref:GNAT family N-acetyltransferase n=1 Tax=Spirilliplanes yamanashiensis TaxID=42233 RepID=A0A8J3YEJ8_9ACTN|nr:GNAT family N-acetyltransferase [Spirilliplanes yamanashiensis]MDP9816719.1 ribosomal protein S18 acetylase RimI-like enzyme [Spirilliplanes yamanashiensis]GIJ06242.1 GNAT family N-acetyltransferase [Spirilliplanes yamanashiensis]
MPITIRAYAVGDADAVVALSMRAWAPVFASFESVLGADIYRRVYPDWLASQERDVRQACTTHAATTWVADLGGAPAGFVTVVLNPQARSGDIEMVAVDPAHQRRGIGDALIGHAVDRMRAAGATVAGVVTGGDPGHGPARRAYEKAGFTALPLVRYYRAL